MTWANLLDGSVVGDSVGETDGAADGPIVGDVVGDVVGAVVGVNDGPNTHTPHLTLHKLRIVSSSHAAAGILALVQKPASCR